MRLEQRNLAPKVWLFLVVMIFATMLGGCSIKIVADFDSTTFEEILKTGKKVDRFYGDLLETPVSSREYQKYAERYVEIETDLRSLYTRNKARSLNLESTEISEIILNLWLKYKNNHSARNGYSDGNAKLDRARFTRLFVSAADAEAAKKLDPDDKDAKKDSK